jgi:hypothetical protein
MRWSVKGAAARVLLLAALLCAAGVAAKPRVRVGSDLDGVPDSEEDDAWREWGKRTEPRKIEGTQFCRLGAGGCDSRGCATQSRRRRRSRRGSLRSVRALCA